MKPRPFKSAAQAFVVWRAATARRWVATYAELAEDTGLSAYVVGETLRRNGWASRLWCDRTEQILHNVRNGGRLPIDAAIRANNSGRPYSILGLV